MFFFRAQVIKILTVLFLRVELLLVYIVSSSLISRV